MFSHAAASHRQTVWIYFQDFKRAAPDMALMPSPNRPLAHFYDTENEINEK